MAQTKLHPGVRWQFRLKGYWIFLILLIVLFLPFSSPIILLLSKSSVIMFNWLFSILACYILLAIVVSELYARLSYKYWFYDFTDTNVKLERGIIWKRYSNIPYERVQNVDITRGILARIIGFSSVMIQTAGYSMPVNNRMPGMAEGYIPAVSKEDAEKIRDLLMKKINKSKASKQGL